ncbi:hypothetical protein PIB30_010460 [Stylosanthes scabra]|uniref:DUF4283 domain-containing protein n=1 Tax=Stylosanthes scabra TaxID=79078 RepID=A0ABU6Y433_9FABA|nr:hypothetical protein [Stylosanthes scabra]
MGSMKILMVFESSTKMEEALDSNKLTDHFLEVRIWSEGEANKTRDVWLEVTGLLLHGWCDENMRTIGNVWGRVIKVGDDEGHFSSFRVLVAANMGPLIRAVAIVVINNTEFQVFVKEAEEDGMVIDGSRNKEQNEVDKVNIVQEVDKSQWNGTTKTREMVNNEEGRDVRPESSPEIEREVEKEESKVEESKCGETEQTPSEENGGDAQWAYELGHANPDNTKSPTRTRSLEDDRRTEQVIREWNESLFQKPNSPIGPRDVDADDNNEDSVDQLKEIGPEVESRGSLDGDSDSTSFSAPPGFERPLHSHRRTSLRLRDRIKENARKQKEINKRKSATIEEIRGEDKIKSWQNTEDEIENSEEEVENTWWIGAKTGISGEYEDRAKKYLRSLEKERSKTGREQNNDGK